MAESSDENNKHIQNKLADDLDSMLDETEASMGQQQEELIDDEDAIDRLLMDNAFDSPDDDESDEFAEIDELISESLDDSDNQSADEIEDIVDEFADDENDLVSTLDGNDIQAPVSSEPEVDEFTDVGDVPEIKEETDDGNGDLKNDDEISEVDMQQSGSKQSNDQSLLEDDFDISAEEATEEVNEPTGQSELDEQPTETISTDNPVEADNNYIADIKKNEAAVAEIYAQLAAIQSEQKSMGQKIADIGNQDNTAIPTDELEDLHSEQKKLKRKLNTIEEKKPIVAYAALAVAIIALLLGGGLGIVGFGADSKVSELAESMVDIEEKLEILVEEDVTAKIKVLTNRLDKIASEVTTNSAQLAAIKKTVEVLSSQPETKSLSQQLAQLGDQSMQIGTAIESLQLQIDALENKKRTTRRKAAIKKKWVVNLISFKQEWYAKRKAAEFERKGIPVDVMKVVIKGKIWYRLRVKGFNSKYAAAAYAAKVKKTLNLTSVWVTTG